MLHKALYFVAAVNVVVANSDRIKKETHPPPLHLPIDNLIDPSMNHVTSVDEEATMIGDSSDHIFPTLKKQGKINPHQQQNDKPQLPLDDKTPILNPLNIPLLGTLSTKIPNKLALAIKKEGLKDQEKIKSQPFLPYTLPLMNEIKIKKSSHVNSQLISRKCECKKIRATTKDDPKISSLIIAQQKIQYAWSQSPGWCKALDPPKNIPFCITPVKAEICCTCTTTLKKIQCMNDCLLKSQFDDIDENTQKIILSYCGYACQGCNHNLMPMVETADNGPQQQDEDFEKKSMLKVPKWWMATMSIHVKKIRDKIARHMAEE
jgi:hypothetical protein